MQKQIYGVLGGDTRGHFLIGELRKRGCQVHSYGQEEENRSGSLEELLKKCSCIIGPIPFTKNQTDIFNEIGLEDMKIGNLRKWLTPKHQLWGGNIPKELMEECKVRKISCYDFMQDEEVALLNAIATAEGLIAEMITREPENLHGKSCLILGFGRCGKILAHKLKGLDVKVTISARNPEDLALAFAHGYQTILLQQLHGRWKQYPYVINTIPRKMIQKEQLEIMDQNTSIYDIASGSGGVNIKAASQMDIKIVNCPGLPGRYAPKTSAKILADCILRKKEGKR